MTGSHTEPPERKVSKIESKDEEKENASLPSMGSPLRCLRLSCSGGDVSTVSRGARGLLRDAEGTTRKGQKAVLRCRLNLLKSCTATGGLLKTSLPRHRVVFHVFLYIV